MPKMNRGFFSSTRADYETPPEIYQPLDRVFGFNLDVCASEHNTKVRDNFITRADDGLAQNWAEWIPPGAHRVRAWMNPEYGTVAPLWISKAREQAGNGVSTVALLASRTDAGWFHDDIAMADFILFLKSRVKFLLPCTLCGKSTVRRRRPSLAMLVKLDQAGVISYETHGDMSKSGTLPVCDACRKLDVQNWGKVGNNSPAMGSMVAGFGFSPGEIGSLSRTSLRTMGVLLFPGAVPHA